MKKGEIRFSGKIVTAITILVLSGACAQKIPSDLSAESIIPQPETVVPSGEYFTINEKTTVAISDEQLSGIAGYLSSLLKPSTGFAFDVLPATSKPAKNRISLSLVSDTIVNSKEGYVLEINRRGIEIKGFTPEGIFRGVQTLRQILPAAIEADTIQQMEWRVATGEITDKPLYEYRGTMLDVSRHFFSVEEVKKHIDNISYYKINYLHLHLSDDQGWRIEIKSWPDLAIKGGATEVGGGAGGYYSQKQLSEIVSYAAERYITVVPEIDMPGHTNAALVAYPELNCDGKARTPYTGTDVGFSTLCVDKEITYKFVDDVVREISALCPGPYFHIGGDESHSTDRDDYIKFIERVQTIVKGYGKSVIGWDEISGAKMEEGSVAQYWSNKENAVAAVKQGRRVLMSPAQKAYIDMKYDKSTLLGLTWAGYIDVDTSYRWDPANIVEGITEMDILGVEAPLWTETVTNIDEVEYMVFPRLAGIAEIGWTRAGNRDWEEYRARLGKHGVRLEAMGINFYRSPVISWEE